MQDTEIRAAGALAGAAVAGFGALAREMHDTVAGRAFSAVGPAGEPVRAIHDGIAGAVHTGVRALLAAGPRGAAHLAARNRRPDAPAARDTRAGSLALAALNGAVGHALEGGELALPMTLRRAGRDVPLDALGSAVPDATPRVVVFVHGLGETDEAWRLLPLRGDRSARRTYGDRLRDELGYTPLYLRYNTGLRISENGRRLAALLDELVAAWPVAVEEIVLVGHSMGGLVARSACHYAHADARRWSEAVRHVFCLGSPHLGAPLEKGANALGWALGRVPETRPLARVVNGRSVGIKDLRFGSCAEDDWCDCDPDELLNDRCTDVPFLPDAAYYFVGSTLREGPIGEALGDLLVRLPSASGRGRSRTVPFAVDNGLELTGLTHFDLLNHPAVYDQLHRWLTRGG